MKIKYRSLKHLFAFGYLMLLLIGGAVIGIIIGFESISTKTFSNEFVFAIVYFLICICLIWYMITLIKCNLYTIELNDSGFIHKGLLSREYRYSEIDDVYIIELTTKGGSPFSILKIKVKGKKNIRLRIDKLSNNEVDYIIRVMKKETGRQSIITKDKKNNFFPLI